MTKNVTLSVAADERVGVANALINTLKKRGYQLVLHGAFQTVQRPDWAWAAEAVARDVASGRAQQGVVCCWTGTGVTIAANKVDGARAALCVDAETAAGARRWNDANILTLSLRIVSEPLLEEILDVWFSTPSSSEVLDQENISYVEQIEKNR